MLRDIQKVPYKSGFCSANTDHSRCASAVTTKIWSEKDNETISKTIICTCMCHNGQKKCHLCKHIHPKYVDYDVETRSCIDIDSCESRIIEDERNARKNSPLIAMIRECQAEGALERTTRNQLRAATNRVVDSDENGNGNGHKERKSRVPSDEDVEFITIPGV